MTEKKYTKIHWLYVIILSRTSFRVNPDSIVCLNVKELLARSRRHIWSLSDTNEVQTHNHLVRKWTLNGWMLGYKLSGCEFESSCCHLRKFMFLKYSFFEDVSLLSVSRNFLETPSLLHIFLENFILSNSIILVEDQIRWNWGFEIFLIDHYASEIRNKNITGKY